MSFAENVSNELIDVVRAALAADGPVASNHPGFVVREGQLQLAQAIAETLVEHGRLVAEAGTGTGKTFAYLVPVLLAGGRVLISTGTRNLQDQLFDRDLPEMLRTLGVKADVALLKGRSNYVCWHHLKRNLADGRFTSRQEIAQLKRIERFAVVSDDGDRASLPGVPEEASVWAHATSTRENCLGQDCDEFERCFVFKARQNAQRADLIVVNHHLFCADLALREEGIADLLPTTDALVFDEAHQLPDVATQFFGTAVSTRRLLDFSRDMMRAGLAEARDAGDWTEHARSVEQAVRELRLAGGRPGRLDAQAACGREGLLTAIDACIKLLSTLGKCLADNAERGRDLQRCAVRALELEGAMRRWVEAARGIRESVQEMPGAHEALEDAWPEPSSDDAASSNGSEAVGDDTVDVTTPEQIPSVIWAEVHAAGLTLHSTPLTVAHAFRRHIYGRPRSWIFLSATLAVNAGFEHFKAAMGLDDARSLVWESPFDYQTQSLMYVPQSIGQPSGVDFPARVFREVWPLIRANRGRAFVLCTTLRMVDQLAQLFSEAIGREEPQIGLLVQGIASRAELLESFRRHEAPLLIGSASFWEGVDVRGAQLSLVVIDKLPFAPPDEPVLRARIEAARRAGLDPFRTMQLPAAAMALKQGAGRLIRSETDHGLLVVCDARLAEKSYGRLLLRSLPPFRRTRSAEQAMGFLIGQRVSEAPGETQEPSGLET